MQKIGISSMFMINYIKLVLSLMWSTLPGSSESKLTLQLRSEGSIRGHCLRESGSGAQASKGRIHRICRMPVLGRITAPKEVHVLIPEI